MTVFKRDIIENLEGLFQHCFIKEQNLLGIQKLKQNDARLTFYKHYLIILDAAIHILILTDKYAKDPEDLNNWKEIHREYNIEERFFSRKELLNYKATLNYMDQSIGLSYFGSIFNIFEHSFRIVSENYDPLLYSEQEHSIDSLFTGILSKLKLNDKEKCHFINIVTRLRNSNHNNGVFISPKDKSSKYTWKNTTYEFSHGKPIDISDIWIHYIKFTKEFIKIFDDLIGLPDIQKKSYYLDITETVK